MEGVRLIAVPMWIGAGDPGLAEGPEALIAALRRWEDLPVEWVMVPSACPDASYTDDYARRHGLDIVRAIAHEVATRVARARAEGKLPLVAGGDHSIAIGSVGGLRLAHPGKRLGVVWVDAHPDLNTPETTPSNHAHGMPLAALLGYGHPLLVTAAGYHPVVRLQDTLLIGIRSIDPGEAEFIADHPELLAVTTDQLHAQGTEWALSQVREFLRQLDLVHLSIDLDAVDPTHAPGVSTPAPGGLTPEEVLAVAREVAASGKLAGVDIVELLPQRDPTGKTVELAVRLITAILLARPATALPKVA